MAKIKVKLGDWLDYLENQVNKTIYVWGANDELCVNIMNKLADMEKKDHTEKEALANVDRALTLLQKRLLQGCDILKIRCADCSGLAIGFLIKMGILKSDTNANGLYEKTKGHEIKLSDVKAGDYLFNGNSTNKWHVGYAVSDKYAVESKDHDVGVVKTRISSRPWKYATRPDWYEGEEPTPVPGIYTLTRELYYTKPYMEGDDVAHVQARLNELGFNCGSVDGVFGGKTKDAVIAYQRSVKLKDDGIVGKNTAMSLGFAWEEERGIE